MKINIKKSFLVVVLVFLSLLFLWVGTGFFLLQKDVEKSRVKLSILKDSIHRRVQERDSLYNLLNHYQDSVYRRKDSMVSKIIYIYNEESLVIDTLSLDDNIELLSRNLSQKIDY